MLINVCFLHISFHHHQRNTQEHIIDEPHHLVERATDSSRHLATPQHDRVTQDTQTSSLPP